MQHDTNNYQVAKGVLYMRPYASTPTAWAASTAYGPGAYVINDDNLWKTVSGGTSTTGAGPTGATGTFTDGTVTWTAIPWEDKGNCPKMEFSGEFETLEHYSSRSGVKTRDKKAIISRKGTLNISLDEVTMETLQFAVLGGTITGATGSRRMNVFDSANISAQVKLVGTNDYGRKFQWQFNSVDFIPNAAIPFIGDDWTVLDLTGEVGADANGAYGFVKEI